MEQARVIPEQQLILPECECANPPEWFPKTWEELRPVVNNCVIRLLKEDDFLLRRKVSERTLSHRIGFYLQEQKLFREWNVDCEYNRIGNTLNTKVQPRDELCDVLLDLQNRGIISQPHCHAARLELKCESFRVDDETERKALPDIIVHKRGCQLHNLLLIEIKTYWSEAWRASVDLSKLYSFTGDVYRKVENEAVLYPRYRFGLFLDLARHKVQSAMLFERGRERALGNGLETSQRSEGRQSLQS